MTKIITKRGERRVKYEAVIIFPKGINAPWSKKAFPSEEEAKEYFEDFVDKHGFDFEWSNYVLVPCTITYSLPQTESKKGVSGKKVKK